MRILLKISLSAALMGLLLILLICSADDCDATDSVPNTIIFDEDEVTVYYAGAQISSMSTISDGPTLKVFAKKGYCNPRINGELYTAGYSGVVVTIAMKNAGIVIETDKEEYSIIYDSNGGTGHIDSLSVVIGETYEISPVSFQKSWYNATEWNTETDGSGETITTGMKTIDLSVIEMLFESSNTVTLYPKWVENSYSISFDNNNGTGQLPNSIQNITISLSAISIPSIGISRTGYYTEVWNTSENGTGNDISPGSKTVNGEFLQNCFGENSSVILYPKWVEKSYLFEFSLNGGSGQLPDSISNVKLSSGTVTIPSLSGMSRTGYNTNTWNTSIDGTGHDISPGTNTFNSELIVNYFGSGTTVTLYPKWIEKSYSIHFNSNGGAGAVPDPITGLKISSQFVDIPDFGDLRRVGFIINGWNTSDDGSGLSITAGPHDISESFLNSYFSLGESITLYPKWELSNFSFVFRSGEGITGAAPVAIGSISKDMSFIIPSPTFTKTGYRWVSWNTSPEGTGPSFVSGDYILNEETIGEAPMGEHAIDLYPMWEPVSYEIRLTTERGSVAGWTEKDGSFVTSYTIESDTIQIPRPESDDRFHDFICWEDPGEFTVSEVASGSYGDVVLNAVWNEREYSMNLNINGRSVTQKFTIGSSLPDPECEDGFEFIGWFFKDPNGSEQRFIDMSQMTENLSIYAVYRPIKDDPVLMIAVVAGMVLFFAAAMYASFVRR